MRVLWLCNIMLPAIAIELGKEYSVREGWLSGTLDRIIMEQDSVIELGICFPTDQEMDGFSHVIQLGKKNISCYGFYENLNTPEKYPQELEGKLEKILEEFRPDMVHIFGTEFPHSLAMAKVFHNPERTLVGLQGIISACAKSYMADLPTKVQKGMTFRDFIRQDSLLQQQEKFRLRGETEHALLQQVQHVTGRTKFDEEQALAINGNLTYHFMNETMRSTFYDGIWKMNNCKKYRIFFSQADYPLKGFHYLLEALPEIIKQYPDTEVVVAGNSIMNSNFIKISKYGKYLNQLVKEKNLEGRISILGKLSAEEMKVEYVKCYTFICASSLENSPNSVAEAMLLGVPVVAASVGGVPTMVIDGESGMLYGDDRNGLQDGMNDKLGSSEKSSSMVGALLAKRVCDLWAKEDQMEYISKGARKSARKAHDGDVNYQRLMQIYQSICE